MYDDPCLGKRVGIDPISDYLDNKIDFRAFPKADYIFITHEHWDHFNPETIAEIKKADTKIIVNPNVGKLLLEGTVMKNGDHLKLTEDISISLLVVYFKAYFHKLKSGLEVHN